MSTSQQGVWSALLATFRLVAAFALACYLIIQVGLALRTLRAESAYLVTPTIQHNFPYLGINVDLAQYPPAEQQRVLQELAAAGFGWVRVPLAWNDIEPQRGQFDWSRADPILAALATSNLEPVIVLNGTPTWARAPQDRDTDQGHLAPPADPRDFATFARAFATRYGAHVRYYQIWDEPNIAPHWGARHIEPVGYAQLLKASAQSIRGVDADAQIVTAALAPTADRGHLALDEVSFLRRLYAAGAAPSFDIVAVQPFGFGNTPAATPVGREQLNFRRAQWIRAAMIAAGDSATPILIARYGWNRDHGSPWATVTPRNQVEFAVAAVDLAYRDWPWVVGQAWAIDQPNVSLDDPAWGFARTPALTAALQDWQTTQGPRSTIVTPPPWQPVAQLIGLLFLLAVAIWRGAAAAQRMPWYRWSTWLRHTPLRLLLAWALLVAIYYVATSPPLIVLCWLVAGWLAWQRPTWALLGALVLLPLHIYHKELHLIYYTVTVPPAYAMLGVLLPAWWQTRPWAALRHGRRTGWTLLALGWLVLGLTGLVTTWYLPAVLQGLLQLVLVPLTLYAMLHTWVNGLRPLYMAAAALAAGGVVAALIGLLDWILGGGTVADGIRRLVGPTFSPNHTALYLVRTLPLLIGLAWMGGRLRKVWIGAALLVAVALLLTGSRGGLLLGLPVGLIILWQMRRSQRDIYRTIWKNGWPLLLVAVFLVGLILFGARSRLLNLATVAERVTIWQASLALWRDHIWFGVGPGGFYWTYPVHIPVGSILDPNLRHPHNLWLEIATQAGWVGLLWFIGLGFATVRFVRRSHNQAATWTGVQVGLLAGLCAALAHAQVDAWQALPDLAAWNWAALALLMIHPSTTTNTKAATPSGSG